MNKAAARVPQRRSGDTFPILFDQGGVFRAHATLDGESVGALVVNVMQVDFDGPIACQVGFTREKGVVVYGPPDQVYFTAQDPALLEVSVKETTPYGVRLYLRPLGRGTPVLQARLGTADGPVIAQREIDEFEVECSAASHIVINAATNTGGVTLTMKPWIPDHTVDFNMFASYSTFAGGATAFRVNTSDVGVDASPVFECVVDPITGDTHGVFAFEIEMPQGENSYCFSATFDQHSTYGTVDGDVKCNGNPCHFKVPVSYLTPPGQDDEEVFFKSIAIQVGDANYTNHPKNGHRHHLTPGDGFAQKLAIAVNPEDERKPPQSSYNCIDDGPFWQAAIGLKLATTHTPGTKYDLKICETPFREAVVVQAVDVLFTRHLNDGDNGNAFGYDNMDTEYPNCSDDHISVAVTKSTRFRCFSKEPATQRDLAFQVEPNDVCDVEKEGNADDVNFCLKITGKKTGQATIKAIYSGNPVQEIAVHVYSLVVPNGTIARCFCANYPDTIPPEVDSSKVRLAARGILQYGVASLALSNNPEPVAVAWDKAILNTKVDQIIGEPGGGPEVMAVTGDALLRNCLVVVLKDPITLNWRLQTRPSGAPPKSIYLTTISGLIKDGVYNLVSTQGQPCLCKVVGWLQNNGQFQVALDIECPTDAKFLQAKDARALGLNTTPLLVVSGSDNDSDLRAKLTGARLAHELLHRSQLVDVLNEDNIMCYNEDGTLPLAQPVRYQRQQVVQTYTGEPINGQRQNQWESIKRP